MAENADEEVFSSPATKEEIAAVEPSEFPGVGQCMHCDRPYNPRTKERLGPPQKDVDAQTTGYCRECNIGYERLTRRHGRAYAWNYMTEHRRGEAHPFQPGQKRGAPSPLTKLTAKERIDQTMGPERKADIARERYRRMHIARERESSHAWRRRNQ